MMSQSKTETVKLICEDLVFTQKDVFQFRLILFKYYEKPKSLIMT